MPGERLGDRYKGEWGWWFGFDQRKCFFRVDPKRQPHSGPTFHSKTCCNQHMDDKRFEIFPSGQYLQIRCKAHPEEFPELQFIEESGVVAIMEITCSKCGSTGPLKCDQFRYSNEWKEGLIAMGEAKHLPRH